MEEIALGQLNMSYEQFYDMTPRTFYNALDGFMAKREQQDRADWERCRWQTCLLLNIHLPKRNQIHSPQRLIKFEWEKQISEMTSYEQELKKIQTLKNKNR